MIQTFAKFGEMDIESTMHLQLDMSGTVCSPHKETPADTAGKEKKILPGRRQQRHSTEIGSEYHRWWVVRNALGFETNEHIAGLLLDGFHGLLQQLVAMCGGEVYQPYLNVKSKINHDSNNSSDNTSVLTSLNSTSPPGIIEDMEEFTEYKNAITFYCESLWKLCGNQESKLEELEKTSQPVQEFLMRLMGYIRAAKGKSYHMNKKKRLKSSSTPAKKSEAVSIEASSCPLAVSDDKLKASPTQVSSLTLLSLPSDLSPAASSTPLKYNPMERLTAQADQFSLTTGLGLLDNFAVTDSAVSARPTSAPQLQPQIRKCQVDASHLRSCIPEGQIGFQQLKRGDQVHPLVKDQRIEQTVSCLNTSASEHVSSKEKLHRKLDQDDVSVTPDCKKRDEPKTQESDLIDATMTQESDLIDATMTQESDLIDATMTQESYLIDARTNGEDETNPQSHFLDNVLPGLSNLSDKSISPEELETKEREPHIFKTLEPGYEEQYLRMLLSKPISLAAEATPGLQQTKMNQSVMDSKSYQDEKSAPNTGMILPQQTAQSESCHMETFSKTNDVEKLHFSESCPTNNGQTLNLFSGNPASCGMPQADFQCKTKQCKSLLSNASLSKNTFAEMNSSGNNTVLLNTNKYSVNVPKVNQHRQTPAGATHKETPLPIQPALYPNVEKSHRLAASLGTPVIFYPANSFQSADNSLASLSSLVQNIVYNSHGTILKPLTPVSSLPSTATYSSPQLLNQTSSSVAPKKSVAAALPVLSSQLNAGKPTLVPFYISHMNSLNNLPKSTNTIHIQGVRPQQAQAPLFQTKLNLDGNQASDGSWCRAKPQAFLNQTENKGANEEEYLRGTQEIGITGQVVLSTSSSIQDSPFYHSGIYSNSSFLNGWSFEGLQSHHHPKVPVQNELAKASHQQAPGDFCSSSSGSMTLTDIEPNKVYTQPKLPTKTKKKILTSLLANTTMSEATKTHLVNASSAATKTDLAYTWNETTNNFDQAKANLALSQVSRKQTDKKLSKRLLCSACDMFFYSGTDLLVHRYEQHSHVCGECDGRFLSASRLKQHKETDHPSILKCSHCRYHTFSKHGLTEHKWVEHGIQMESKDEDLSSCSKDIESTSSKKSELRMSTATAKSGFSLVKSQSLDLAHASNTSMVYTSKEDSDQFKDSDSFSSSSFIGDQLKSRATTSTGTTADPMILVKNVCENTESSTCHVAESDLSGPVFPSFIREPVLKHDSNLLSISAMYAQVSQHCQMETSEFLSISDQNCSENDEPRLIIDTDVASNECEKAKSCLDLDEPLCLVTHNRAQSESHFGQSTVLRNKHSKRRHTSSDCSKKKLCDEYKILQMKASEVIESVEDSSPTRNDQLDGRDSSVEAQRLVMKISCKHSIGLDHLQVKKKQRKRKKQLLIALDNDDEKHIFSLKVANITDSQVNSHTGLEDNQIKANEIACKDSGSFSHGAIQCKRVVEAEQQHFQSQQLKSLFLAEDSQSLISSNLQSAEKSLEPKKMQSLQDRHLMSCLPPKKRRLRRFSRSSSKDDKGMALEVVNLDIIGRCDQGQLPPCVSAATRKKESKNTSLTPLSIERAARFKNQLTRLSMRCTRTNSLKIACNSNMLEKHKSQDKIKSGRILNSSLIQNSCNLAPADGRFCCPVVNCQATFSRKWNLDGHIGKVHCKMSNMVCSVSGCDQIFLSRKDLRQHITVDHKGKSRKYKCSWPDCNKGFFARTHLRIHTLTHTGEKPVACQVCEYRCRQPTALIWHMRKHGIFQKGISMKM